MTNFQRQVVCQWNPSCKNVSECVVPSILHRDETTTNRFDVAVIEMLCYSGIIEIKERKNENIEWVLSKNWNKKNYACA